MLSLSKEPFKAFAWILNPAKSYVFFKELNLILSDFKYSKYSWDDFDLSNICFEDIQITYVNFDEAVSKIKSIAFVPEEGETYKGKVKSINGNACVVETEKGNQIKSLKVNVNAVGDQSTVSLRPERVEINSSDSNFENSFDSFYQMSQHSAKMEIIAKHYKKLYELSKNHLESFEF